MKVQEDLTPICNENVSGDSTNVNSCEPHSSGDRVGDRESELKASPLSEPVVEPRPEDAMEEGESDGDDDGDDDDDDDNELENSDDGSDEDDEAAEGTNTGNSRQKAWRRFCVNTCGPITVKLESDECSSSDVSPTHSDGAATPDLKLETQTSSSKGSEDSCDAESENAAEAEKEQDAGEDDKQLLNELCLQYAPKVEDKDLNNGESDDAPSIADIIVTPWHTYDCGRGEIRLSETELRSITQYIESRSSGSYWRLSAAPESHPSKHHGGLKTSRHKRVSHGGSEHRVRSAKRVNPESDSTSSPISNRRAQPSAAGTAAYGHSSETWFTRRSTRVSQPFGENLKKAPDWVRRFHRLVTSVCQQDDYRDISTELTDRMSHEEVVVACGAMGPIQPLGLNTILSNLESNEYDTPLEVFNELYSIWIGGFRRLPPGTAAWAQAHAAAAHFLRLVSNEPLKGEFNPPNSPYDPAAAAAARTRSPDLSRIFKQMTGRSATQNSGWRRKRASDSGLDQHVKTPSRAPRTSVPKSAGEDRGRGKAVGRRKNAQKSSSAVGQQAGTRATDLNAPITPAEREYFQSLLAQLQHEHHLELYIQFQSTAVWKQAEEAEGDDVDLDDKNTSPKVFRKMIGWCRHVLGHSRRQDRQRPPSSVSVESPAKRSAAQSSGATQVKRSRTDGEGAPPVAQTAGEAVSSSSSSNSSSSSSESESSDSSDSPQRQANLSRGTVANAS